MTTTPCKDCGNPVSTDATSCPKCGAPVKRKTSFYTWALAILFGLFLFASLMTNRSPEPGSATVKPKINPSSQLKLEYQWTLGGFGNVLLLRNVRIHNPTDSPLKDPMIRCSLYAASGTSLGDAEIVVYQPLPAKKRISIAEINMGIVNGQAKTASCRVPVASPM